MKAIITKSRSNNRIKVQAEGVPHIIVGCEDNDKEENHRAAALKLCEKYRWGTSLVSGGLPTPGQWAHCFVPQVTEKKSEVLLDNTALVAALERIVSDCPAPGEDAVLTVGGYNQACVALATRQRSPEIHPLVAAGRVLDTTFAYRSSDALVVSATAWQAFKAELDKLATTAPVTDKPANTFEVTVAGCTREQAEQVLRERLGHDEDYGFDYSLNW